MELLKLNAIGRNNLNLIKEQLSIIIDLTTQIVIFNVQVSGNAIFTETSEQSNNSNFTVNGTVIC